MVLQEGDICAEVLGPQRDVFLDKCLRLFVMRWKPLSCQALHSLLAQKSMCIAWPPSVAFCPVAAPEPRVCPDVLTSVSQWPRKSTLTLKMMLLAPQATLGLVCWAVSL